ncbi:hypothetical protein ACNFH5_05145 [Pseudomonas sp. NY15435]|uniref:hypothetical protein n=1 Tax=Pseudomonas TaxID=286 RepID=UPI001486BE91|nr:hypothetical protein [Pseudomonas nitroreducens]
MAQQKKAPGRNGFQYKPRFGVIVVCPTEQQQQEAYQRLKAQGFKVRVVCV